MDSLHRIGSPARISVVPCRVNVPDDLINPLAVRSREADQRLQFRVLELERVLFNLVVQRVRNCTAVCQVGIAAYVDKELDVLLMRHNRVRGAA